MAHLLPRLCSWEDALAAGMICIEPASAGRQGEARVVLTADGRRMLEGAAAG